MHFMTECGPIFRKAKRVLADEQPVVKCNLCQNEFETLENSHIISECFYKDLYDRKHRFVPINQEVEGQLKLRQKGFTEKLLCKECENKFSKWEDILFRYLCDIGNEGSSILQISNLGNNLLSISGTKYDQVKKGILSIFWRASIATLPIFKNYNFGPYDEDIRQALCCDAPLTPLQYPIIIRMALIQGAHAKGMIMFYPRFRLSPFQVSQYLMVINGFLFVLFLTKDKLPQRLESILLRDSGPVLSLRFNIEDLQGKGNVLDRIYDADVKTMMHRLELP